ncbi:pyridoxamine 5'-phosphate oxidase family protein [Streptomyces sp. ME19-01-6]|uniref:pyridoxamine 5'-phosphate oxidase family protein n=1 Tax=Streptomyces sp. ME19-01-6 TaxID=3028686 RepID=UPI0029BC50CC|nr:pyridoxamine 5'-phosphate oxidase family protein [Streptomyces sp. ME19-01-6]MDX3224265.1 pyridoxamine 5'-phosphate oxidase family protein [Streptomyces sp. ME19-01-6]
MGTAVVRGAEQRKRDALERLEREVDVWVASADPAGAPCLVPLSFLWDGDAVWLSTREKNPTGRNLRDVGRARLSLADTRDVVLVEGVVETFARNEVPVAVADAFAAKCEWDPRASKDDSYVYFKVSPTEVQVWHEERESRGRHLMRDGKWVI